MGILRTDKISGLETPTAVTGSVEFDGNGDYLRIPANTDFALGTDDWTVEWFAYPTSETQYQRHFYLEGSSSSNIDGVFADSSGIAFGRTGSWAATAVLHPLNQWNHYALVHDSTNMRLYINGVESTTSTNNFGTDATKSINIGYSNSTFGGYFTGNISNFRILRGTALYTSDFTVPTHALEVIKDTVLLCCNNPDSAGAASYAGIGTSHTITVNGDATASTDSPSLTRDFTGGTEFKGVTTFDTQGYFVPPSGTTEQRGRGRGVLQIGTNSGTYTTSLNYIDINSSGISQDFGDQSDNIAFRAGFSSVTRGVWSGGTKPAVGNMNSIEFVTLSTTGNALDFGNLGIDLFRYGSGASSSTRGVIMGGYQGSGAAGTINTIQYVTIASLGDTQDFGDLQNKRLGAPAFSSPTRALVAGGFISPANINSIEYITIATTGNGVEFGDTVSNLGYYASGGSDGTRGVFGGGDNSGVVNTLQYVTIAALGNAQDFGDLTTAREFAGNAGATSKTRVAFCGGGDWPAGGNTIDYITIQSTGNAIHFGDISSSNATPYGVVAVSDSHGGLS